MTFDSLLWPENLDNQDLLCFFAAGEASIVATGDCGPKDPHVSPFWRELEKLLALRTRSALWNRTYNSIETQWQANYFVVEKSIVRWYRSLNHSEGRAAVFPHQMALSAEHPSFVKWKQNRAKTFPSHKHGRPEMLRLNKMRLCGILSQRL